MKYIILVLLSFPFFLITSAFADCYGCNFDNKNLAYFVFADQDLSNASFQGAYLVNADFSRANLQGATFDGAYANGTIFIGAQLDNVSFRSTELELANFSNALYASKIIAAVVTSTCEPTVEVIFLLLKLFSSNVAKPFF